MLLKKIVCLPSKEWLIKTTLFKIFSLKTWLSFWKIQLHVFAAIFAQLKIKKKTFTFFRPNHKTLSAWWEGKHTVSLHASDYDIKKIITE